MPETPAGGGQGPTAGAQGGTTGTEQAPPVTGSETPPEEFDRERALATILTQRESEKALKARLAVAERDLKDLRDKDLPDNERLTKRVADLEHQLAAREAENRTVTLRAAVTSAAARLGYNDPDDAYRMLDTAVVQYDDDGQPKGVAKLLEELLKAKPYLGKGTEPGTGSWGAGATGQPGGKTDMDSLIRQKAGIGG